MTTRGEYLTDRRLHLKQAPWRLRMAWHTARGEYHRLSGEFWRILADARHGEPVTFERDDFRQLDELYKEMGVEGGHRLNPHQLVEVIRRAPDPLAAKLVARMDQLADQGGRCWEHNHEGRIERYETEARQRFLAEAARRG